MRKKKPRKKTLSVKGPVGEKNPWRVCPVGQHYRRGGPVSGYVTRSGKTVSPYAHGETCVQNPSGKDQLYPEEITKIAQDHMSPVVSQPLNPLKKFGNASNAFDHFIVGWTQYWNDVLKPEDPLDPDLVKALIASESSFNPNAWNHKKGPGRARGLMQVTDQSLRYLTDEYDELKDHYLNLSEDDALDPNMDICAGVRWLFRKKELMENKKREP